jgi:hypothetical protein
MKSNNVHFCQVVEESFRPMEFDIKKLAYFEWMDAGKPNGQNDKFYFSAENYLKSLEAKSFHKFVRYLNYLRSI